MNMALQLTSTAFHDGQPIPKRNTCDGEDASPDLAWSGVPDETKSLALIVDDPDAPGKVWVHWVIYDLPADARGLPEGVPQDRELRDGSRQGKNDFGKIGYGGPCPPRGPAHRYFFKLYALREKTGLKPGASKDELERAIKGRVLAQATLTGKFGH
ncbi:MAG: YbhB/YbcL family Raf kinase inhibitor-like protein [Candidatus Acidiferrales bacterium]